MRTKEIEVQVLGKTFNFSIPANIKSDDFMEIIDYVENKFKKVRREIADLDSFRLGLLVAINITEEFYSLKKENENLRVVLERIDKMIAPVDDDRERVPINFSSS
jgi:cell division protein ZapA (FtsZ GTPase activity inhibitor)